MIIRKLLNRWGTNMKDHTIKHLELIQAVITRMAQNSFSYKGWAITIVSALFALAVAISSPFLLLIAILPILIFWGLDAYYLRQERLFRRLYDNIRITDKKEYEDTFFSMDTSPFKNEVQTWWRICWSITIGWLYGPLLLIVLIVFFITYFKIV